MKKGILVSILALVLISACSALDSGEDKPYDGFSPDVIPPTLGYGPYEGTYVGNKTLAENSCEGLAEEVGAVTQIKVDVLQSLELVSLGFEDESEVSGQLKDDNTATFVKKDISSTNIYHLTFSEDGIIGESEYVDHAPLRGQIGEPCAKYTVELTRE